MDGHTEPQPHSLTFHITGSNAAEVQDAALRQIRAYSPESAFSWSMRSRVKVETQAFGEANPTVVSWEAEVEVVFR